MVMSMFKSVAFLGAAIVLLSACAPDPRSFESEPVDVKTAQGIVTCQLYTKERVLWDRAIDRPEGVTIQQADAVCRAEGRRLQQS